MTSTCNVFRRSTVFDGNDRFGNHFTGRGANDVGAEDPVGFGFCNDLYEAVFVVNGFGAGVGGKGETAHFVFDAFGLDLFLGFSDPGGFGPAMVN